MNAYKQKKSAVLIDNNLQETCCLVSPQIEISSNNRLSAAHVTWQQPMAMLQRLQVIPEWIFFLANQTAWYIPICSSQELPNPSLGLSAGQFFKNEIFPTFSLSGEKFPSLCLSIELYFFCPSVPASPRSLQGIKLVSIVVWGSDVSLILLAPAASGSGPQIEFTFTYIITECLLCSTNTCYMAGWFMLQAILFFINQGFKRRPRTKMITKLIFIWTSTS